MIFYMRNARANISIHKFHSGVESVGGWVVGWVVTHGCTSHPPDDDAPHPGERRARGSVA